MGLGHPKFPKQTGSTVKCAWSAVVCPRYINNKDSCISARVRTNSCVHLRPTADALARNC